MQHTYRLSLCLLVFAPGAIAGQAPPNLTGTWVLQENQSDLGTIGAPVIRRDVIDHREPQLTVQRTVRGPGGETTGTFIYAADGKAYKNRAGPNEITSTLKWEGATLVVLSTLPTPEGTVTLTDRITLAPDGKTLTLQRVLGRDGLEAHQTMVFAKQG